jgi:hypothetical protein
MSTPALQDYCEAQTALTHETTATPCDERATVVCPVDKGGCGHSWCATHSTVCKHCGVVFCDGCAAPVQHNCPAYTPEPEQAAA